MLRLDTFALNDPLLSPKQVAAILGISIHTLAVWRHLGKNCLAWVKLGKRAVRYKLSDVERFVHANRHTLEGGR